LVVEKKVRISRPENEEDMKKLHLKRKVLRHLLKTSDKITKQTKVDKKVA